MPVRKRGSLFLPELALENRGPPESPLQESTPVGREINLVAGFSKLMSLSVAESSTAQTAYKTGVCPKRILFYN